MLDVTDTILSYREATRHLWNTYFMKTINSVFDDNLVRYEEIDKLLFTSLVLNSIGKTDSKFKFRDDAYQFLRILPCEEGFDALQLRISDPVVTRSRSWNAPVAVFGASNAILEFIECFDWNMYNWVSFPYFRIKIRDFPNLEHLSGLEALVEIQSVRVFSV